MIPSNLLWTISFFFLFKYDVAIIKQPSSYSLGKKIVKFWNNKNHCCQVPLRVWENVGCLWGTRQHRIRYLYKMRNVSNPKILSIELY